MLSKQDRATQYLDIETLRQTRIENVRLLADAAGSWVQLSKVTGRSESFLVAIAGPNPRRNIGEVLARDIERRLTLQTGWLDESH